MEQKKYKIGGNTLTQGELSLNDSKKMVTLLKDLNWAEIFDESKTMYEIIKDYLDANILETMFQLVLKGEWPEGEIGDNLTAGQSVEIINDFFVLNASLIANVQSFLINLAQSSEGSGEKKNK